MYEKTIYICDYCGKEFDDDADCCECEISHTQVHIKEHKCITCENFIEHDSKSYTLSNKTIVKGTKFDCYIKESEFEKYDINNSNDCVYYIFDEFCAKLI